MKTTEFLKKAAKIGCYFVSTAKNTMFGIVLKQVSIFVSDGTARKKLKAVH